jgi:hypothetical protein
MGTVVKKDTLSITSRESSKFTVLFWNIENTSYKVDLEVKEAPKDWLIIIQPKEFILNSSTGEEYISLPYINKNVKTLPVNIFVKPNDTQIGEYTVIINAKAGLPGETISFFQERDFKLTVKIIGKQSQLKNSGGQNQQKNENKTLNTTGRPYSVTGRSVTQIIFNYLFYFIIAVCILVISFLIYKI